MDILGRFNQPVLHGLAYLPASLHYCQKPWEIRNCRPPSRVPNIDPIMPFFRLLPLLSAAALHAAPAARFDFEGNTTATGDTAIQAAGNNLGFAAGVAGKAAHFGAADQPGSISFAAPAPDPAKDFSISFWVRTTLPAEQSAVLLSQKEFGDRSLASQKSPGWVIYASGGTWAWNMGSGKRRITHEHDRPARMPLNDGKWHQLAMTYDATQAEVRLYYDGDAKAVYHVGPDFDFSNAQPITAGGPGPARDSRAEIGEGTRSLQKLVDEFHGLGLEKLAPGELLDLVSEPKELIQRKAKDGKQADAAEVERIMAARSALMKNPYTVFQIKEFNEIAPLGRLYVLAADGKVSVRPDEEKAFLESEKLQRPDFDLDELEIHTRVLTPAEVQASCAAHIPATVPVLAKKISSLIAADWNIWHGGRHFVTARDGWDSRQRIAAILKQENVDVILMQETYSGGDGIAAELGYYFAAATDWDYLNQGANISVLSRYPIKELRVPGNDGFMNIAVKVALSETQEMWVMSNWYGMNRFPAVFDFHRERFDAADQVPVIFGGDFNAVPHTDGGESPASRTLLEAGFTDAFRSLHPDVALHPGHSHREGVRIDQIYYKGRSLKNTATRVISTWPGGFPSDHYLILSCFDLAVPE